MAELGSKHLTTGPVRVGVVGLRRGRSFARLMALHPDAALVALCDRNPNRLREMGEAFAAQKPALYEDFTQMLGHDLDAVVLANDAPEHALLAIAALRSGRHVLSEVPACGTLGEALELVEAVEGSGGVYMMAENYCFSRAATEMRRRYRAGDIGEFQHGEGEYVHDTEHIWPELTGGLRDHWRNWRPSTFYCTHSLAPLLYFSDTRVTRVVAMETPNRCGYRYGRRHGDSAVLLCQLSNGATAKSLHSHGGLKRDSLWLCAYGTKGGMETNRWDRSRLTVRIEGKGKPEEYVPRFEDSYDLGVYEQVAAHEKGHGGGDFYPSHFFLQTVLGRCENKIDVFRALDMSLPGLLGFRSIMEGNAPYDIPDFRRPTERERWRGDHWSVDPKYRRPGYPTRSSSTPFPDIPDAVYARQREAALKAGYPPVERM